MKALRSITLLLFVTSLFTPLFAQQNAPKHQLKFGFGSTIYGGTDFQGKTRYLEFERQLFSRFSIGIDGNWGNAVNTVDQQIDHKLTRFGTSAYLFFAPIRKSNNQLKFGFGGTYQSTNYKFSAATPSFEGTLPSNFKQSEHGFAAILEYEVFIVKNWSIGSRFSIQQIKDGNRNYFWGLNTGVRF